MVVLQESSPLPPPLAPWPYDDEDDDEEGEEEESAQDEERPAAPRAEDSLAWSKNIWRLWNPEQGTSTTDLPPVAVAALADAIAAAGQSPTIVIADLRAELADAVANDSLAKGRMAREVAAINRLEAELCGGAVPADKCAKCRVRPRTARMVCCMHLTLCDACEKSVSLHVNGHEERAKHLSRLMCPVCRGFEIEDGASADSIFAIVDRDGNGVIESSELLHHLLVAGQEVESIAELFRVLDTDADGVISREEWNAGFDRFLHLAQAGLKAVGTLGDGVATAVAKTEGEQASAHGELDDTNAAPRAAE